ncbi:DivIVA domain-containing protein [Glycomyces arizonensis]|uniref:DivIVA domain-containing protein n=1 Tax=Glycomyces arizonensis TaxID=256035 RepID=UPI000685B0B7|nr:DivIVA domain-containing protein [Glycomyces arizonensis]
MSLVLPVVVAAIGVWIAFSIVVWATGQDGLRDNSPEDAPAGLGEEGPVTESGVGALRFDTGLRGYRTAQVDAAMNRLAWEIGRRDERLAELEKELAGVERPGAGLDAIEAAPEDAEAEQ